MKRQIITIAAIATCLAASADTTIGVHIGSHHAPAREYQNFNPGVYVRWSSGITVGGYYNSERRPSVYAGYTHQWGRFALTAGLITGYERRAVMPMLVPSVRLGTIGPATMRLAVLPKLEKRGATVLHLMAEF